MRNWIYQHKRLCSFAVAIKHSLSRLLMRLFWLWPIQQKKVTCSNFGGKGFGDNGKAVVLRLLELRPTLDIVWMVSPGYEDTVPAPIRTVKCRSIAYYHEMATAAIWLDNIRKSDDIVKRKGQYYIQMWHGAIPLKKIEKDIEEQLAPRYIADAKYDSKLADIILSGCGFMSDIIHKAFWYDGEILESGSPRLDVLFHPTDGIREMVRAKLGIPAYKTIVLYAPTFRDDGRTACYQLDFDAILEKLCQISGKSWVFVVRLHPNVSSNVDFIPYSERIVNATSYPDLYELIQAVDMVISDYSSIMFEAALLKIPVFLYAADLAAYYDARGFYFDIRQLPFALAENTNELLFQLQMFDPSHYETEISQFFVRCRNFECGKATEAVVNKLLSILEITE